MTPCSLVLVVIALCIMLIGGCASRQQIDATSATGGVALKLRLTGPARLDALYDVDQNGVIRFAGGRDARHEEYSWTGQLTDEQLDQLDSLVAEHRLASSPPDDVQNDQGRMFHLTMTTTRGRERYTVGGGSPQAVALYDFLDRVARRRFDDELQALPKPGPQQ